MKPVLPLCACVLASLPLHAAATVIVGNLTGRTSDGTGVFQSYEYKTFNATFSYDTDAFEIIYSSDHSSRWKLKDAVDPGDLPSFSFNIEGHQPFTVIATSAIANPWTDSPPPNPDGYYRNGMRLILSNGATLFELNFENQSRGWNYLTEPNDLASWVMNTNLAGSADTSARLSDLLAGVDYGDNSLNLDLRSAVVTEKVPEPIPLFLLGFGLVGVLSARRRPVLA